MKLRNGFVSNSSSSSFIVFGIKMEYDELPKDNIVEIFGTNEQKKEYDEIKDDEDNQLYAGELFYEIYSNNNIGTEVEYYKDNEKNCTVGIYTVGIAKEVMYECVEEDIDAFIAKGKENLKKLGLDTRNARFYFGGMNDNH